MLKDAPAPADIPTRIANLQQDIRKGKWADSIEALDGLISETFIDTKLTEQLVETYLLKNQCFVLLGNFEVSYGLLNAVAYLFTFPQLNLNPALNLRVRTGFIDLYIAQRENVGSVSDELLTKVNKAQDIGNGLIAQLKEGNNLYKVDFYLSLAHLALVEGDFEKVTRCFDNADADLKTLVETEAQNPAVRWLQAKRLQIQGLMFIKRNASEAGINDLRQACDIYAEIQDVRGEGKTALIIGRYYASSGKNESTRIWLKRAQTAALGKSQEPLDKKIYTLATSELEKLPPDNSEVTDSN